MRSRLASVRLRLLALVALAIIPSIGILLLGAEQRRQADLDKALHDASLVARLAAQAHEQQLDRVLHILSTLADVPVVPQPDDGGCGGTFTFLLRHNPHYQMLGVLAPDGSVICMERRTPGPSRTAVPLAAAFTAAFTAALDERQFAAGEFRIDPSSRTGVIDFAYPVISPTDLSESVQAVLVATLDLAWLRDLQHQVQLPEGSAWTVFDRHGDILARYPDEYGFVGRRASEAPVIRAALHGNGAGTAELPGLDGVQRLYGWQPLRAGQAPRDAGDSGVFLSVGIPPHVAFAEAERNYRFNLAALAAIAVLAFGAAWVGGDVFFLRQINALGAATARMAAGDLDARTGLSHRGAELERLAQGFDTMAEALAQRERRLQEALATLASSEARFRRLAENAPDVIYRYRIGDDSGFEYISPAAMQVVGYSPEDLYRDPELSRALVHPEDVAVLEGIEAIEGATSLTLRLLNRDGDVVWTDHRVVPVYEGGRLVAIEGIARDVTAAKANEEALKRANRQLEEALNELQRAQSRLIEQERLRALGELAGGIAHDFNNALSPIVGFSELLLAPGALDDRVQATHLLELIRTGALDAAGVVARLREFYRPRDEVETFEQVDLNRLILQVTELTQPRWKGQAQAAGRTIEVRTALEDIAPVVGSEPELREALTNLIFNAVDAMPDGGTISLRTRPDGPGHVCIEVADTGTGMPAEVRRRVMEPFFTTKGNRGTGLGLSMVYGTMLRHHGSVAIESAPGQGTTVTLRLPVSTEAAPAKTEPGPDATATGTIDSHALRILVAEDEAAIRDLLAAHLNGEGHAAEIAVDGKAALEAFGRAARGEGSPFDLIITDRAMPHLGGDQLAATVRASGLPGADVPIILLTGFGDLMRATEEVPPGVTAVVSKPFTRESLRRAIRQTLAQPHRQSDGAQQVNQGDSHAAARVSAPA